VYRTGTRPLPQIPRRTPEAGASRENADPQMRIGAHVLRVPARSSATNLRRESRSAACQMDCLIPDPGDRRKPGAVGGRGGL
jgi:hypothetical protein